MCKSGSIEGKGYADDMPEKNYLIYVSNAGVLMNLGKKKILIDGLCSNGFELYKETPANISKDIILGIPPYDRIDLILITHHHQDHFDPALITEYIRNGGTAAIVSTEAAIAMLKKRLHPEQSDKLIALDILPGQSLKFTEAGIDVEAFSMAHYGKEYQEVRNLAFLIKDKARVLHVGDGASDPENYKGLQLAEEEIDLMIVPFPYVSLPSARRLIGEWVGPKKIASLHLPGKEQDSYGWIEAAKKSVRRADKDFPQVVFLEDPGEYIFI